MNTVFIWTAYKNGTQYLLVNFVQMDKLFKLDMESPLQSVLTYQKSQFFQNKAIIMLKIIGVLSLNGEYWENSNWENVKKLYHLFNITRSNINLTFSYLCSLICGTSYKQIVLLGQMSVLLYAYTWILMI